MIMLDRSAQAESKPTSRLDRLDKEVGTHQNIVEEDCEIILVHVAVMASLDNHGDITEAVPNLFSMDSPDNEVFSQELNKSYNSDNISEKLPNTNCDHEEVPNLYSMDSPDNEELSKSSNSEDITESDLERQGHKLTITKPDLEEVAKVTAEEETCPKIMDWSDDSLGDITRNSSWHSDQVQVHSNHDHVHSDPVYVHGNHDQVHNKGWSN